MDLNTRYMPSGVFLVENKLKYLVVYKGRIRRIVMELREGKCRSPLSVCIIIPTIFFGAFLPRI